MARGLLSGAPRLLGRHNGKPGRWYDLQYRALAQRLGPFTSLTRQYAGLVAAAWVTYRAATERLIVATAERQHGKGRRPSAATIRQCEKRSALALGTYDASLRRLEELCRHTRPGQPSPMQMLANEPEAKQ